MSGNERARERKVGLRNSKSFLSRNIPLATMVMTFAKQKWLCHRTVLCGQWKPQNNFVKLPIGRKVYFNPIAIPSVYSDLCYTILNKFFTVVIMYGRITMPKSPNQKLKLMFVFRGVFIGHLSWYYISIRNKERR